MYFDEEPVRVVARPKLSGVGEHVGVLFPHGVVAHRTPAGNALVSFNEFAQGRSVRTVKVADRAANHLAWHRAVESLQQGEPYRVADNNCEHYAFGLIGERPTSPQVAGVVAAAGLALLAYAFG